MNPRQKIQAIRARLSGTWDDPMLKRVGPLGTNTLSDIQRILDDDFSPVVPAPIEPNAWVVEFMPQRWEGDLAMIDEARGTVRFAVNPDEIVELTNYASADDFEPDTGQSDELRWASTAPVWIQDWDGPFYIELVGPLSDLPENERQQFINRKLNP